MTLRAIVLLAFAVCSAAADSKLVPGRDLYRENCAVCHDIEKDKMHSRKLGPSLNHLFKNAQLPMSHSRPNRPYVEIRIKYGGALMPAFAKRLDEGEINAIIDYLASK